jgi:hypothetical protein
MFGRRKRELQGQQLEEILFEVSGKPHKGELLDACKTDVERRSLCLQWAGELRTQWYDGLREHVTSILLSDNLRYKQYPPPVRRKIAEQQWSRSAQARDLAATEQMYSRWAQQYSGGGH